MKIGIIVSPADVECAKRLVDVIYSEQPEVEFCVIDREDSLTGTDIEELKMLAGEDSNLIVLGSDGYYTPPPEHVLIGEIKVCFQNLYKRITKTLQDAIIVQKLCYLDPSQQQTLQERRGSMRDLWQRQNTNNHKLQAKAHHVSGYGNRKNNKRKQPWKWHIATQTKSYYRY